MEISSVNSQNNSRSSQVKDDRRKVEDQAAQEKKVEDQENSRESSRPSRAVA
ncbi:MAG TPA: hypothetical protein PKA63_08355 [Oligoflexia bacterium]|nr:hypothetical protein [Oligoflexia bacterium]HMP48662.1 hypothetical protein [Oligoflexia bacterium]